MNQPERYVFVPIDGAKEISEDEPCFVLRGSDRTAALILEYWTALNYELGLISHEKLKETFSYAQRMREWACIAGEDLGK